MLLWLLVYTLFPQILNKPLNRISFPSRTCNQLFDISFCLWLRFVYVHRSREINKWLGVERCTCCTIQGGQQDAKSRVVDWANKFQKQNPVLITVRAILFMRVVQPQYQAILLSIIQYSCRKWNSAFLPQTCRYFMYWYGVHPSNGVCMWLNCWHAEFVQ